MVFAWILGSADGFSWIISSSFTENDTYQKCLICCFQVSWRPRAKVWWWSCPGIGRDLARLARSGGSGQRWHPVQQRLPGGTVGQKWWSSIWWPWWWSTPAWASSVKRRRFSQTTLLVSLLERRPWRSAPVQARRSPVTSSNWRSLTTVLALFRRHQGQNWGKTVGVGVKLSRS